MYFLYKPSSLLLLSLSTLVTFSLVPSAYGLTTAGTWTQTITSRQAREASRTIPNDYNDGAWGVRGYARQRRAPQDDGNGDGDSDPASLDTRPTPSPTGSASSSNTIHIQNESDFSLILPRTAGVLISDSEEDGIAYGTPSNPFPVGLITAAVIRKADDGSWIQVTGCIDPSKSGLNTQDAGGQYDVRFPNGAQCTFGGYAASFIEQVEPDANRFCLRCCNTQNDQVNCNSHRDRAGCLVAIPGQYAFPDKGVDCSG